jgi:hypothetical protein
MEALFLRPQIRVDRLHDFTPSASLSGLISIPHRPPYLEPFAGRLTVPMAASAGLLAAVVELATATCSALRCPSVRHVPAIVCSARIPNFPRARGSKVHDQIGATVAPRSLAALRLLRSGQVKMRKIDGWHEMARTKQAE